MKIQYTSFVLRQFAEKFAGTNLSKVDQDKFLEHVNFHANIAGNKSRSTKLIDGKWDFLKYLIFENWDKRIKQQVVPITDQNRNKIKSDYKARTPEELPVLSRYIELKKLPMANYIVVVLYSREQLLKEFEANQPKDSLGEVEFDLDNDCDYGIVAILGTEKPQPDPIVPATQLRNALGVEYGGNGEAIDNADYMEGVKFWSENVLVKQIITIK